jgi:hypothetical protein
LDRSAKAVPRQAQWGLQRTAVAIFTVYARPQGYARRHRRDRCCKIRLIFIAINAILERWPFWRFFFMHALPPPHDSPTLSGIREISGKVFSRNGKVQADQWLGG